MLRLRRCILSHLLSSSPPSTRPVSPFFPLHRLLSATASSFSAKNYLVANCGLSRAQALKVYKKISHLKSPSKPDAVRAFLTGLGLSRAEVATVVTNDPCILCADVEKTLARRIVELRDLGLTSPEISRLVLVSRSNLRSSSLSRNVDFLRQVFGSIDELLLILKSNSGLLGLDPKKVVKPNLAFLHQGCGISISKIPNAYMSRMVTVSMKHLQEALARVDEFGIERGSTVFPRALAVFAILSQQKLNKNIQLFEKLGWSRVDIALAVRSMPHILGMSEEKVRRNLQFLTDDVGLEIPYIAQRPTLMLFSIEHRLLPRHFLINFLKEKGLLNAKHTFYYIASLGNDKFLHRFVDQYEASVPGLTAAFASSCSGKHLWEKLRKKNRESADIKMIFRIYMNVCHQILIITCLSSDSHYLV